MTLLLPPRRAETAEELQLKLWVRGCLSKRRYALAADANRALKRLKRVRGARMHWYYCLHCAGHHLASGSEGNV